MLAVVMVGFGDGRRVLGLERTYRGGLRILFDPTDEEVEIARSGSLWQLWNTDRAVLLASLDGETRSFLDVEGPESSESDPEPEPAERQPIDRAV
ncbi:MAG: hypothetical protein HC897_03530 [Thermoanaerobaculia bacterium]|nr:hypothetical protein [Thermoanaerobaculia bacterium]